MQRIDTTNQFGLAVADIFNGLRNIRLWGLLGWQDIKQRYRRSVLGPFWLTLSTGIMIFGLGLIYAAIFKQPMGTYLPFLTCGLIIWTLLSSLVTEGCQAFIAVDAMIRQIRMPFSLHVYRLIWRNLIIFAHNSVVIVLVLAVYGKMPPLARVVFSVPGLIAVAVNAAWIGVALGILCARFRDIPQIVGNLLQLTFYVTPIIWQPNLLPGRGRVILANPFYHFVEIVRAPLLGQVVPTHTWLIVGGITVVGWGAALGMLTRYRRRIAYWL